MSFITRPYNLFAEVANIPIGIFNVGIKTLNGTAQRFGQNSLQIKVQIPYFNKVRPVDKLTSKQPEWIRFKSVIFTLPMGPQIQAFEQTQQSIPQKDFLNEAAKQNLAVNPLYTATDIQVFNRDGDAVTVSTLVQGKVYVAILRHLGCTFCWDFARQLKEILPDIEKQGFKLVMISLGASDQIPHLEDTLQLPKGSVFIDRDLQIYPRLNFFGPGQFFSSDVFKALSKYNMGFFMETMKSYEFHAPPRKTDVLQLGGALIVDGPKVIYARRDEAVGDHPSIDELLNHMKWYNGQIEKS